MNTTDRFSPARNIYDPPSAASAEPGLAFSTASQLALSEWRMIADSLPEGMLLISPATKRRAERRYRVEGGKLVRVCGPHRGRGGDRPTKSKKGN